MKTIFAMDKKLVKYILRVHFFKKRLKTINLYKKIKKEVILKKQS